MPTEQYDSERGGRDAPFFPPPFSTQCTIGILYYLVRLCGWLPVLCCDDGQAHLALLVHVGVVDAGLEGDLGRLEGVLGRELDVDPEGALGVGSRVRHKEALPLEDVLLVNLKWKD